VMVHDLSPKAVKRMVRVDLANASEEPPSLIGFLQLHAWDEEDHPNLVNADAAPPGTRRLALVRA